MSTGTRSPSDRMERERTVVEALRRMRQELEQKLKKLALGIVTAATITATTITAANITATTGFTGPLTGNVTGNLTGNVTGNITGATGAFTGAVTAGSLTVTGNTTLGDLATADTITTTARFASVLTPSTPNTRDLGDTALPWRTAYLGTSLGVGFTGAISTGFAVDVLGKFGVRPSSTTAYPAAFANGIAASFHTMQDSAAVFGWALTRVGVHTSAPSIEFYKTRSTTGSPTAVVTGDSVGTFGFQAASDGTTIRRAAAITAVVNGTVSAGTVPVDIVFQVSPSADAFGTTGAVWRFTSTGAFRPETDNAATLTIGTASFRPSVVYGVTGTFTNVGGTLSTAAQPNVTSVGTLTSLAVGAITSTGLFQTTLTTEQARFRYDTLNYLSVTVGISGAVTFDAVGAGAAFTFSDTVNATTFVGALTGNATTATSWATARTLTIGSTGKAVDGSANVTWTLAEIGAQAVDADLTAIAALGFTTTAFLKKTALDTWALDTNIYLTGNQTITLSGDVTGSGATAITTTLATVNANVGSFGSSTSIPTFTVNAKGLITAASGNVVIAPAGTLTGTVLAANVVTSSLTTIGTLVAGAVPLSLVTAGTSPTGTFIFPTLAATTRLTSPLMGTTTAVDVVIDRSGVPQVTFGSLLATFAGAATVTTTLTTNGTSALLVQGTGASVEAYVGAAAGVGAFVGIRSAAATLRDLNWYSAVVGRWTIRVNSDAESGSDAGSSWSLIARTDAGAVIDSPIVVTRAAAGNVAFARPVTMSSTLVITSTLTQNGIAANLVQGASATLNIGSTTSTLTAIAVRGAAATTRYIAFRTADVDRWFLLANSNAESGADAGTPFVIRARTDAGAAIDDPLTIIRAAAGAIAFSATRPITGFTYNGQTITSAANFTGTLTVATTLTQNGTTALLVQGATGTLSVGASASTTTNIVANGAAGSNRTLVWRTAGINRMGIAVTSAAESGSDAGSNLVLASYTDAGALIDNWLSVTRAVGGAITFSAARPITGGTYNGQTISATAAFTGTASFAGLVSANLGLSVAGAAFTVNDANYHSITRSTATLGLNTLGLQNLDATVAVLHEATLLYQLATTAAATVIAGGIKVAKLAEWTAVATTQDSSMALSIVIDGALSTALTLSSSAGVRTAVLPGNATVGGTFGVTGITTFTDNVNIGTTGTITGSPRVTLHAPSIHILMTDSFTNALTKTAQIGAAHYTNAEEPILGMQIQSALTYNAVYIGGVTASFNAATDVQIYTGATTTTVGGTLRAGWNGSGTFTQYFATTLSSTLAVTGATTLSSTLRVNSGLSFLTIPNPTAAIVYADTGYNLLNSGTSHGVLLQPTLQSLVSNYRGLELRTVTAAAVFTVTSASSIFLRTATIGAGSAITTQYGLHVEALTGAATNYAIYTNAGLVRLGDAVTMESTLAVASYGAVGGAVNDSVRWYVRGTLVSTATSQYGILVNPAFTASATTDIFGVAVELTGAAGTHTTTNVYSLAVRPFIKGALQTITNLHGLIVAASTTVATVSYGVRIGSITGGTTSYALYTDSGLVRLGDAVTMTSTLAVTGAVSGAAFSGTSWTGTGLMQTTLTTEQMRLRYDSLNYLSATVASSGSTTLELSTAGTTLTLGVAGEILATFRGNSSVKLYFDNVVMFSTTATGVDIAGDLITGAPGGAAAAWKFGSPVAGVGLILLGTEYLEVSVGGVIKKVALVV